MKYCTSHYQNESIRDKVHELRFNIQQLNNALVYAEYHPEKRILIEIPSITDKQHVPALEKLRQLQEEYTNLVYDFYELTDLREYAKSGKGIYMYHYPVTTWAMVQILLYYSVSDIVLGEPIVFDLPAVLKYIKNRGVYTRICPHKVKTDFTKNIDINYDYCHFFVVPQHAELYNTYIDVFDLIDSNISREETLVNIYTKNSPYTNSLDLLIENLTLTEPATCLDKKWVNKRMACGQKCMKDKSECTYCSWYFKIYRLIHKDDVIDFLTKK